MNPSPTANRSFLHGSSRKAALISDKVVYATLDSLALKRARLPLQLLPADNGNLVEKTEKADKEKRAIGGKTSPKRPTYKVHCLLRIDHDPSYRIDLVGVDFQRCSIIHDLEMHSKFCNIFMYRKTQFRLVIIFFVAIKRLYCHFRRFSLLLSDATSDCQGS